MNKITWFHNH